MRKLCVFDIEVLPNCFICCCKVVGQPTVTFEISVRKFQLQELVTFFKEGNYYFVGYNCIHYDTPIVNMLIDKFYEFNKFPNYLIVTAEAHKLSNTIINGEPVAWVRYKYKNYFKQIDLMTMMASKALRVGLKSLQVTMCYPNVREMKVNWSQFLEREAIDNLIYYCHNDVGSTTELLKLLKGELQLRVAIQKEFGISCLSKDGVGIGVDIFTKYICEELGLANPKDLNNYVHNLDFIPVKDYVCEAIAFKTKPLQDVHDWFNNMVLYSNGLSEDKDRVITIGKLQHSLGLGGMHSINRPNVYIADEEFMYIDADVAGFYPSLSEVWGFGPAGFKKAFINVIRRLKADRLVAKAAKDKSKDTTYKLALNSILGHLRNEFGPYYAPEANVAICVNGQLMLLMLIEECELNGIECISSNTDGITVKIRRTDEQKFYDICKEWEVKTKMILEYVEYEKMVIVAVNDYIAFKKGYNAIKDKLYFHSPDMSINYNFVNLKLQGDEIAKLRDQYVKEKGMFITQPRLGKGMDSLIIPKALQNYFGKGIPIEDTIKGSDTIWDFISFQKIGKQYDVIWKEEEQQHINRYYVCRSGAYLYKVKHVDKFDKKSGRWSKVKSYQNVLKGFGVELMNEYEDKPIKDYNADHRYYISKTREIIQQLEPIQQTLF